MSAQKKAFRGSVVACSAHRGKSLQQLKLSVLRSPLKRQVSTVGMIYVSSPSRFCLG